MSSVTIKLRAGGQALDATVDSALVVVPTEANGFQAYIIVEREDQAADMLACILLSFARDEDERRIMRRAVAAVQQLQVTAETLESHPKHRGH